MDGALLSEYQALQLLALGPCLFMLFFLCVAVRRITQIFVPCLYFLSLACTFVLPMHDVFTLPMPVYGALLLGKSLTPALSLLLIIQFISGRMPGWPFWCVLAVPLIGESPLIYATLLTKSEVCIYEHVCAEPMVLRRLYEIFSGSLIFLLTITLYHRMEHEETGTPYQRRHKYALIIALIVLNLALLGINLAELKGIIAMDRAQLASTVVRIGFIYLVLTSVFRVFDRAVEIAYDRLPSVRPEGPNDRERQLAETIRNALTKDRIYRNMDMSREKLAAKLAVTEHHLSRVINQCFGQNFSALINQHRVAEAQERLVREDTAITVIAFEVGFSSIPSFNRVFKQTVGVSPSEFRNMHGAGKAAQVTK